ncbi:MAG: TIGR01777 family oxidoreductase [Balneolaceae bacterium]
MEIKKFLITGGTGFIGSNLGSELMKQGHFITVITRSPEKYKEEESKNQRFISWDANLVPEMEKTDVVVNLAGEILFGQRWTDSVKEKIYNSRINSTRKLVEAIKQAESKPRLLVSASAVGIYGDSGEDELDESSPLGDDFLAKVCIDWEKEAQKASAYNVRVVNPRFGIALEEYGGMLEQMKLPFSFFVGGSLGSGKQYVSWIHMRDLIRTIIYPVENEKIKGVYNATSPNPERMDKLAKAMGSVMNRPSIFRVPEFALKLVLGEAAQPALTSIKVQPRVLLENGFKFEYDDLREALADIL